MKMLFGAPGAAVCASAAVVSLAANCFAKEAILRSRLGGNAAFDRCMAEVVRLDKILWNGEYGTIRHAPLASRVAWMRDVTDICEEHGIPHCAWNYLSTPYDGNRFSLVDDDTREFLSKDLLNACLGRKFLERK